MSATAHRRQPPLLVQMLTKLRVPAAFALLMAAWPVVLPLLWLITIVVLVRILAQGRKGSGPASSATTRARAAAPAPRQPANAIARASGRLPRR